MTLNPIGTCSLSLTEGGRLIRIVVQPRSKTAWGSARKKARVDCRFHDLLHTALPKMAEACPGAHHACTGGHKSRAMLERYSHIRMKAKREVVLRPSRKSRRPK